MAGPHRPIDDISESCRGSRYDDEVASSTIEIVLNSLHFVPGQLLPKPDNAGPHQRSAFRTSRTDICMLLLLLVIVIGETKIAARTLGKENIAMNLHHLLPRESRTPVQVVHVLRDEQELVGDLSQSRDRDVRCIWLRVADALPALAIPFPNQSWIAHESFRRCQLCRIEVPPATVLSAIGRNSALSGNARASDYKNTHFM